VKVGSVTSSTKQKLILARMSPGGVVVVAIAFFALLWVIVHRLVASGMGSAHCRRQAPFALVVLFLDRETHSYSLSRFQLFLFAFVFLFSYLYVLLCRWLVQWAFELPNIPANLSGMLAVSAGTTVSAAAATNNPGQQGGRRHFSVLR